MKTLTEKQFEFPKDTVEYIAEDPATRRCVLVDSIGCLTCQYSPTDT